VARNEGDDGAGGPSLAEQLSVGVSFGCAELMGAVTGRDRNLGYFLPPSSSDYLFILRYLSQPLLVLVHGKLLSFSECCSRKEHTSLPVVIFLGLKKISG
jgi:hypothetical protein